MGDNEMIEIVDVNGSKMLVQLVTYLISEDRLRQYLVYSKGETQGNEGDQVIYISKLLRQDAGFYLDEIVDDAEWNDVQRLLKKIANAE